MSMLGSVMSHVRACRGHTGYRTGSGEHVDGCVCAGGDTLAHCVSNLSRLTGCGLRSEGQSSMSGNPEVGAVSFGSWCC